MRILMLGWEFPPYFAGGVGTVCYALTKALIERGNQIIYIMPKGPESLRSANSFLDMHIANNEVPMAIHEISSLINSPYISSDEYDREFTQHLQGASGELYGKTLLLEVERFAKQAARIALKQDFDVIHAHDWVTFKAGILIKQLTGKPLVVHMHITEFDKSGGEHANPQVYAIEREGMLAADTVIAVSNFVKNRCIHNYFIPEEKIKVVYNSIDTKALVPKQVSVKPYEKVVLFLGRVTLQKGPEYFLYAAQKVAQIDPNVRFILAGSGDMLGRMIELSAELGLGSRVIFTGFTPREESDQLFALADVFVMPSVSEPFGLVPLEAMAQGTPSIISKQSGVSEVFQNALKVDFWNIDDLANKILAALYYDVLHDTLKEHGTVELQSFTWSTPAASCEHIYGDLKARKERGEL